MPGPTPCPLCGTHNSPDDESCKSCGFALCDARETNAGGAKCARCGSAMPSGFEFCPVCGQDQRERSRRPGTQTLGMNASPSSAAPAQPAAAPPAAATAMPSPFALVPGAAPPAAGGGHTMPTPQFVSPDAAAQARAALEHAAHLPPVAHQGPAHPADHHQAAPAAAMPPVVSAAVADEDATVPAATGPVVTFEDAAFGKSPSPTDGPAPGASDDDRTVPFVLLKQVDGGSANLTIPAMFIAKPPEERAVDAHTRPDRPGGFSGGPTGEAPPDGVNVAQPSAAQIAQAQSSRVPTYPGLSPARLVLVARDGTEGESFPFVGEAMTVGRTHGDILFPEDPFLSPVHVRLNRAADGILLTDSGSTNGVYLRIGKVAPVYPGDMFMIGHQLLRLDQLDTQAQEYPPGADGTRLFGTPLQPAWGRVTQLGRGGVAGDHMYLRGSRVSFGREGGDHVFPNDPFVSREHARLRLEITGQAMAVHLEDLGSANGTYVRIRGAAKISGGDTFRVGDQILKLRLD